jgi:hypothetical protein
MELQEVTRGRYPEFPTHVPVTNLLHWSGRQSMNWAT